MPFPRLLGVRRILRTALVASAALSLITCAEDPIGPASGNARLRIVPVFGPYARVAPLILDRVRIIVERLDPSNESSETVFDEFRSFDPDQDQLRIDDVLLRMQEPSEDLFVTLQLLSGSTLLFDGGQTVTVVRGRSTPQTSIPVSYQGPGSNVFTLVLAPRDTVLSPDAAVDFRLDAFDVQGAQVAQYYVSWSLTGGPATGARINAAGRLTAPAVRDTFYVKVVAPNGVMDSTRVVVAPFTPPTVIPTPLAAGDRHTCEIRGAVTFCWGGNAEGELGDGTTTQRLVPTPVAGGRTFVAVSAGLQHTCALTAQGQAFCWGDNSTGALGDGSTTSSPVPVAVSGGLAFAQIAAANAFTCAVTLQGEGRCWGSNFDGQLGDGTTSDRLTPTIVAGGHSFTRISAAGVFDLTSDHACAIDGTGQAWCWGANADGQLGNGTQTGSSVPVAVSGGLSFSEISLGGESSCAITTAGTGFCWGNNFGVQLTTPQPVQGGFSYTALDMGGNHVCGRTATGWLCGGDNGAGQLGDGTTTDQQTPVAPAGGLGFSVVAAGGLHTCGVATTGTYCWGNNGGGQLGTGDVTLADHPTPTRVVGPAASVTLNGGGGQSAPPGSPVAVPPSVLVRDGQGNPVPGVEVSFAVTAGGGTVLGGGTSETVLTDLAGIATVSGWVLGPVAGANGLSATVSASGVTGNPVSFTATGTGGTIATFTWTGATSADWSVAGNWSPAQLPGLLDSVVIGTTASGRQPSLSTTTTVGAVNIIAGGNLTINGQGISIVRGLTTGGTGVLTMTNDADVVVVGGNAVFGGGNELNLLSAGGISIGGNLTQLAGTSGDSYHPSGTHVTLLAGTSPTVSFATPGLVPGTSHFQEVAWVGTGSLTLLTPAMAHENFVVNATGTSTITSPNGSRLTVGNFVSAVAAPVVFNGVPLTLSQTTPGVISVQNVTFQGMATNVSQLVVNHPGGGGSFIFSNLVFSTTPVAPNGFYLDVTDVTGPTDGGLTIDMVTPTPATPGSFVRTAGGAVVNWPPAAPINTWTGTAGTAWSNAGSWSLGVVPSATDSVVIPAATNQPVLTAPASVGAVTVSGGTLTLNSQTLTVSRTFATTGTGTLTSNTAASLLVVAGSAVFGGGDETGLLTDGNLRVAGDFTQGSTANSFVATGFHTVFFNGTGAQSVTIANGSAASSRFQNARVANGTGTVTLSGTTPEMVVNGTLALSNGATLTGATAVTAANVSTSTGSTLSVFLLTVPAGGITVAGTYGVNSTILTGGGTVPAITYNNLRLTGATSYTLATNLTTAGYLDLQSELVVAGRALTVGGDFSTTGTGILTMTNAADLVTVAGSTSFYGGDETGKLTAGILRTSNQFLQDAGTSPTSFLASGTHTVEIVSQNPSGGVVNLGTPVTSRFQNLRVLFISSFVSDVVVNGNMEVNFNAAANLFARRVTVGGNFTKGGIGFFGPTRLTLLGGATVTAETVGPDTLEFAGTAPQTFPPSTFPKTVLIASDVTGPGGALSISGDLVVQGTGIFRLGGTDLTVGGSVLLQGNGRFAMTSPSDQLKIALDLVAAGGDETGLLTDGILRVARNFTQSGIATSFVAGANHLTIFNGNAAQSITFSNPGVSVFRRLQLANIGGPIQLGTSVVVDADLLTTDPAITTVGGVLRVGSLSVNGLTLNNTSIVVDEKGVARTHQFDNVTFQNLPATGALPLSVTGVGASLAPRVLTFNTVNFPTLPVGAGNLYVKLTSSNLQGLTLRMLGSNQGIGALGGGPALSDPPNQTTVLGATILWQ